MKIIYHSHSFIEIELKSWSILIDPFITWNPTIKSSLEDILAKKILSVVLTHGHSDHIWDTEKICKKTNCLLISIFEISNYFWKEKWLTNLHAMHIWWEFDFWEYKIKYTKAVHGWWVDDMRSWYTTLAAWIIVRIEWKNIYHAWDTALNYDMKLLSEYDSIDLAFLPIWGNFTMWIYDAVIATKDFIKPKKVVPIHYNTFDIIKANPEDFIKKVWDIWKIVKFWDSIIL
jgi:L-ascorbate metabolism protein UlaG (beta-lactamase superfamily)